MLLYTSYNYCSSCVSCFQQGARRSCRTAGTLDCIFPPLRLSEPLSAAAHIAHFLGVESNTSAANLDISSRQSRRPLQNPSSLTAPP